MNKRECLIQTSPRESSYWIQMSLREYPRILSNLWNRTPKKFSGSGLVPATQLELRMSFTKSATRNPKTSRKPPVRKKRTSQQNNNNVSARPAPPARAAHASGRQRVKNTLFCPSHEKFLTVVLKPVRTISDQHENPPMNYEISRALFSLFFTS